MGRPVLAPDRVGTETGTSLLPAQVLGFGCEVFRGSSGEGRGCQGLSRCLRVPAGVGCRVGRAGMLGKKLDRSVPLTPHAAPCRPPAKVPPTPLDPGAVPPAGHSPAPSLAHLAWVPCGGCYGVGGGLHPSSPRRLCHRVAGPCWRVGSVPFHGAMGSDWHRPWGCCGSPAQTGPLSPQLSRRAQPLGKQEEPVTNRWQRARQRQAGSLGSPPAAHSSLALKVQLFGGAPSSWQLRIRTERGRMGDSGPGGSVHFLAALPSWGVLVLHPCVGAAAGPPARYLGPAEPGAGTGVPAGSAGWGQTGLGGL